MILDMANLTTLDIGKGIGRGAFWRGYRLGSVVHLLGLRQDWSKECMAALRGLSPHIPDTVFVGFTASGQRVYRMPFYSPLTSEMRAWEDYQTLRRIRFRHRNWEGTVSAVAGCGAREPIMTALRYIMGRGALYGADDVRLEFNRGNLGVDAEGNLVLRDVLFFATQAYRLEEIKFDKAVSSQYV